MTDMTPKTVADLIQLTKKGEVRTFKRAMDPTGHEPEFYYIGTAGEFPWHPRWDNAIPIETCPRPPFGDLAAIPLPEGREFHFTINAPRERVADLYGISTGLYLVSDLVLEMLDHHDPSPRQVASAHVRMVDGSSSSGYKVVMPLDVRDAVDISKTDVTVESVDTGSGIYVTWVKYHSGYVFRDDIGPEVVCFLERYNANWMWRIDFIRAVIAAGARGLRAEYTYRTPDRPVIRS